MNLRFILPVLAVMAITACNKGVNNDVEEHNITTDDIVEPQVLRSNFSQEQTSDIEQKIIKHASIDLVVADVTSAKKSIDSMLLVYKSVVINDRYINGGYYATSRLEVRVPSENFSILLEQLQKIAKSVTQQVVNSEDVTEEYIDIQAKIKNKKKVERSLLALLNKASNVEDILKIQIELGNVRAEIESIQGRMNYIDNQVKFSSISIRISPEPLPEPTTTFWQKIGNALESGYEGLAWCAMFLISTWPIWVIVTVVLLAIRWRRKKKADKILMDKMEKQAKKFERKHKKEKKKDVFKDSSILDQDLQQ